MYYLTEEGKKLLSGVAKGDPLRRFTARAVRNLRQYRQSQGTHGTLDPRERAFIRQRARDQELATGATPKKQQEATDKLPEYDLQAIFRNIASRKNLSPEEQSDLAKRVGSGMGGKIQRRREKLQAQGMYRVGQATKK